MFTGIVFATGRARRARRVEDLLTLEIDAPSIARDLEVGDSVSVNGVCLTATKASRRKFTVEVMGETLVRSTMSSIDKDSTVNLELAVRFIDRMGGHLVQGHVDGVASVVRIDPGEGTTRVWFSCEEELLRYMVPRGSIALDGVALTLVEVGRTTFQVALIPHTLSATTLSTLQVGDEVNVEVDLIAKYVERFMRRSSDVT